MSNGHSSFRFVCALICACLLLGSCSAIRTIYNQAEHLIAWRLDDYFDLTEAQRALFHERFAAFHRWHRRSQLPGYVALLSAAEQRVERGPNHGDVDWLRTQARSQAQAAITHGQEDIVALLRGLTDRQVAHAQQRFERDNRKWAREHGVGESADEQRRLRAKLDIEHIEHWTGSLTREQKTRIARLSSDLPLDADAHLRDRRRRQREFLDLLAGRNDARFPVRLRQWLENWDATRPRDLDAELDRFDRLRADMIIEVYAVLGPAQRDKVRERVHWYADALRDLAGAQQVAESAEAGQGSTELHSPRTSAAVTR